MNRIYRSASDTQSEATCRPVPRRLAHLVRGDLLPQNQRLTGATANSPNTRRNLDPKRYSLTQKGTYQYVCVSVSIERSFVVFEPIQRAMLSP
ncbi:Uncharacterised protein [Chlamydia trachomatis]|nr:Uncharacterised protein [Chlamydia trachomatis]